MASSKSVPARTRPFSSGCPSNTNPTPPSGTRCRGLFFSRTSIYPRSTARWYARLTSPKEHQWLGLIVLAPNLDGCIGHLLHFEPVQNGYQSTQFGCSLSSGGIRSNFGLRYFGGFLESVFIFTTPPDMLSRSKSN